ncbi:MAG: hypothetical protein JO340_07480 [Acidobacteriaceae bacterium]|nr:hypothetical protein [Acidobacteriaceae bacterium]
MTVTAATHVQLLWKERAVAKHFRSGVSLHSHTAYSEESLDNAAPFIAGVPFLRRAIQRQEAEYNRARSVKLDLQTGYWTPPLAPRQAHRLEQKQIEAHFQLPALVSLTDHDDIRAGMQLRVLPRFADAPVSTEWTIPFEETFFHLGVHNLPPSEACAVERRLSAYTARPEPAELSRILELLHAYPDVLLVLNHPLWDEKGIGRDRHLASLKILLQRHGPRLHALELNGLRAMSENRRILEMGKSLNIPVVAGGDRHGMEPNAILNLSRADSLPGFVHEIRRERFSHVVFMPQYRQPRMLRIVHTVIDALREYPENFEGRRTWPDRVFYRDPVTGAPVPLSSVCNRSGARIVGRLVAAMRVVDRRPPSVILTSA